MFTFSLSISLQRFFRMKQYIIIDLGNTLGKVAVFEGNKKVFFSIFEPQDEEILVSLLKKFPNISSGLISSVREIPKSIFLSLSKINLHVLTEKTPLPFEILYQTAQTLGRDRIAAVAYAYELFPQKNVLVIDMGTCITYDILQADGKYLGGSISPGINMRFKALNAFTSKLPLVEPVDKISLIGNTTITSLQSGVINGVKAEIEGIIKEYCGFYEDLTVLIGGGDNKYFDKQLKNSIFAAPNLVIEGLRVIFNHNEIQ